MYITKSLLLLNGQKKFEFWGQFLLAVEPVRKVNPSNSTVGMDGDPECLDVVGPVGSPGEVGQVELDLVPALVQAHGHGTDEGLDPGCGLVIRGSKSSSYVLIVQDLHFEGEIFFELSSMAWVRS